MRRILLTFILAAFVIVSSVQARSWADLSPKIEASIGQVTMGELQEDDTMALGDCTAFNINEAAYLFVTAAHCNGIDVKVEGHAVGIVLIDEKNDVMLLQVPGLKRKALKHITTPVRRGEAVASFGFAYGWSQPMLRVGHVGIPILQTKQMGNRYLTMFSFGDIKGMSGGPVVNIKGEVVSLVQQSNRDGLASVGLSMPALLEVVGKYWEE